MRILVTGDSGLMGSHLVDLLVKDHEVIGISSSTRNDNSLLRREILDLRDRNKSSAVIEDFAPEIIFHLAANAAEGKSMFSPIDITTNGINTFYNVLVPAIKAGSLKRFVFTSSIAVYGSIHVPFRESDLPLPQDLYGINKLAVEQALRVMSRVHDFEYVVVRPHNVTGPRQNMSDPYRNVVTLFMNHLLKNKPYSIYGNGEMRRCFSYVKDVVDIIYRCGFEDVAGMTFNVGSDTDYSINELSHIIQQVANIHLAPIYLPDRVQEVHTAIADHTLVKKVFGYKDTPLRQVIEETWAWCKEQGSQEYSYTDLEIPSKKAPQNWRQK
jgi:UDP-glucose 4-epimerase